MFTNSCNAYVYDVQICYFSVKSFKCNFSKEVKLHVKSFIFPVFVCVAFSRLKTAVFDTYMSQLWKTYALKFQRVHAEFRVWEIEDNFVSYISTGHYSLRT